MWAWSSPVILWRSVWKYWATHLDNRVGSRAIFLLYTLQLERNWPHSKLWPGSHLRRWRVVGHSRTTCCLPSDVNMSTDDSIHRILTKIRILNTYDTYSAEDLFTHPWRVLTRKWSEALLTLALLALSLFTPTLRSHQSPAAAASAVFFPPLLPHPQQLFSSAFYFPWQQGLSLKSPSGAVWIWSECEGEWTLIKDWEAAKRKRVLNSLLVKKKKIPSSMDFLSFVLFNLKINFKDWLIDQLDERSSYFISLYYNWRLLAYS